MRTIGMLLLASLGGGLAAQPLTSDVRLEPLEAVRSEEWPRVGVVTIHPAATRGGYGAVRFWLRNPGAQAREVLIEMRDADPRFDRVRVDHAVRLQPEEERVLFLPLPCCGIATRLSLSLGGEGGGGRVNNQLLWRAGDRFPVLCVTTGVGYRTSCDGWLMFASPQVRGSMDCRPDQLPSRWAWLSGFAVVFVDGSSEGLTADRQRVLAELYRGGGMLVVTSVDRLPEGPLRDLCDQSEIDRVGLGDLAIVDAERANVVTVVRDVVERRGRALGSLRTTLVSQALFSTVPVPGISGLPTNLFFLLTLAFAVTVGPLNHLVLWRRRKPWLALITVPIIGFAVAAFILVYSIASEGLGTRGVIHSLSMLDQVEHRLVGVDARVLFAGISPESLKTSPYGFVSTDMQLRTDEAVPQFRFDSQADAIDGAVLPSRRLTPVVSVQQRACRDRLRLRLDEKRVELSESLRLAGDPRSVVVRDFDGDYWTVRSDGSLESILPVVASQILDRFVASFDTLEFAGTDATPWVRARLELGPGSFVGRFVRRPESDEHGLSVTYAPTEHLIRGRLDQRDVIR